MTNKKPDQLANCIIKNVTEKRKKEIRCLINNVTERERDIDYGEAIDGALSRPTTQTV
jgi:hypothetical protein